jgi:thiol-disulfide isomerase/thioredoxin
MTLRSSLLCLFLAAAPTLAVAESAAPPVKDEVYLLNHRVTMPPLAVWDGPTQEWRAPVGNEGQLPTAKVRILHLWGTYCKPCQEEFPLLKQIDQQLRTDYKGEVQFLFVADSISSGSEMKAFMAARHAGMPTGLLFRDAENKLASSLLQVLPQQAMSSGNKDSVSERSLSLPVTLLLDGDNVVRMAVVGSLIHRRGEIVNGIAQLHRTLSSLEPAGNPKGTAKVATKKTRTFQ